MQIRSVASTCQTPRRHNEPMTSARCRSLGSRAVWLAGCLSLIAVVASLLGARRPPLPYKDGAPSGMTGGFGDKTCHSCHFDQIVNHPDGLLEISGVPEVYQPDSTYLITIRVARPNPGKAGFALTARFDHDTPAGRLAPADSNVQTSGDFDRNVYVTHTEAGSSIAGDTASWKLRWTAPNESNRSTVFNVAANAANGDDSEFGDWIYVLETLSRPD